MLELGQPNNKFKPVQNGTQLLRAKRYIFRVKGMLSCDKELRSIDFTSVMMPDGYSYKLKKSIIESKIDHLQKIF